ncbi:MAG TPA: porin [Ignavibacteriales bacterium]|nr:porin [Ignavibacteriales bacterium]
MKIIPIIFFLNIAGSVMAQQPDENKFSWSGALETYYLYDVNNPASKQLPGFVYSQPKHNQVSINYALIDAHYADSTVHANFGLITGDYPQRNYSAEPETYRHLYEANIGFQILNALWIDAGVMPSHIGLEGALTQDNMTLSHSLMAHNSPFYESGIKVSYSSAKWLFAFLLLNGWQNINDNNNNKAVGTQIQWKPTGSILLNSSTFIGDGTNLPDSLTLTRYFHDFYLTYSFTEKMSIAAAYDIGIQQRSHGADDYFTWWGTSVILKYKFTDKTSVSARGEYFSDKNQAVITTNTPDGFQTTGFSANLDYLLKSNLIIRLEAKHFSSKDDLFPGNHDNFKNETSMIISSFDIKF